MEIGDNLKIKQETAMGGKLSCCAFVIYELVKSMSREPKKYSFCFITTIVYNLWW